MDGNEMKKTIIYSVHCNRPDFISWQVQTFTKWFSTPFEFVVVNNADEPQYRASIDEIALANSCRVLNTKSERSLPGHKHADALKQLWKDACQNKEHFVMIIDGDVFMIGGFNIKEHLSGHAMSGCKQQREYKWHWLTPVVMVFDMEKLPEPETIDWEGGAAPDGTRMDVAGNLFYYLEKHPEVKEAVRDLGHTWHIKNDNKNLHILPDEIVSDYKENWNLEIFGKVFLHYCRSSNWDGQSQSHHLEKTYFVGKFLSKTLNDEIAAKDIEVFCDNDTYFGWGEKTKK